MRSIIVGDVHGCSLELRRLLARIAPSPGDRLMAVGDFVAKGPSQVEALELWRDHSGESVLGNNEQKVLRALEGTGDPDAEVADAARELEDHPELVEWIRSWPTSLHGDSLIVVHGGLYPHLHGPREIDEHRSDVLRLRRIRRTDGDWVRVGSSHAREDDPFWAEMWEGPETVIYGHTPGEEVAVWPRAFGIDTGCVYGGRLTAALIDEEGRLELVAEPAERVWYSS